MLILEKFRNNYHQIWITVDGEKCDTKFECRLKGENQTVLHSNRPALLDFPPNATHKICCNMPYLVAIDTIATKLFRGPWDAKGRVALGYCDVVHQVVANVFLLQRNATLQLGFLPRLFWLQSVLLRRIWGVAKGAIATFLFCCKL
jgi:hypothetical protein